MPSTDDILDQISHARRDSSVSPDAMRWSPEQPTAPAPVVSSTSRATAVTRRLIDEHGPVQKRRHR